MRELVRTNDLVLLSFLESALRQQNIEPIVLDVETSALDGWGFGLSRRMMVQDEDFAPAQRLLDELRKDYGPL